LIGKEKVDGSREETVEIRLWVFGRNADGSRGEQLKVESAKIQIGILQL
jgi:hypothetical protein